jgi:hypothetical protein
LQWNTFINTQLQLGGRAALADGTASAVFRIEIADACSEAPAIWLNRSSGWNHVHLGITQLKLGVNGDAGQGIR